MHKRCHFGLRLRLLTLVLLALLPAFALIVYQSIEDSQRALANAKDSAMRLVRLAAHNHEQLLGEAQALLAVLTRWPQLLNDRASCRELLSELLKHYPKLTTITVIDLHGTVTCSSRSEFLGVNYADRQWFQKAAGNGKMVVSEYLVGRVSKYPLVALAAPVLDESGRVRAVVGIDVRLNWINRIHDQLQLPEGSTFTIVDGKGTVPASKPDPELWVGKPDIQRIYALKRLGNADRLQTWSLSVGLPRAALYEPARAALTRNLLIMSALLVLVVSVAYTSSWKLIIQPFRALVEASVKWSAGDLSARTGIENRHDEIGQLAAAFDRMAENLRLREADRLRAIEAKALWTAVVESSSDAIIGRTLDGIVTSWNKGAENLFGYRAEEMIGRPVTTLLPEGEPQIFAANTEKLLRGEKIEPYDAVRRRKDGTLVDVSITVSPIFDDKGNVVGVSASNRDIRGRKRAENELKALHDINLAITSSLQLKTVLQILLEKIDVLLPYGASHIRLLDRTTGGLEPMACRNIDEEDWKAGGTRFRHEIHRTILSLKRPVVIADLQKDHRVSRADFYRRHGLVSYLGLPLIVKDEGVGVLSLLTRERHAFTQHEIQFAETLAKQASVAIHNSQLYDERKRIADQLAGSEDQIRALANGLIHARDEEARRIAHALHDESGQLLAMVYVALDELSRNLASGDKERVQSIKSLLDDVESRLRELSHELHPAMLDHLGLIPSIDHLANQIAKRNGIQVEVAAALDVRLSPLLELTLFRVVQEAFNNSVRHGRAKRIDVRIMQDEELIQCAIRDDGAGFHPAAVRSRERRHGQGLGLAGMRERIESIGGVLQIISAPGEGTKLITEGKTNKEISQQLGMSVKTVDSHRRNLMLKLDIHETAGLVHHAVKIGLIQP